MGGRGHAFLFEKEGEQGQEAVEKQKRKQETVKCFFPTALGIPDPFPQRNGTCCLPHDMGGKLSRRRRATELAEVMGLCHWPQPGGESEAVLHGCVGVCAGDTPPVLLARPLWPPVDV